MVYIRQYTVYLKKKMVAEAQTFRQKAGCLSPVVHVTVRAKNSLNTKTHLYLFAGVLLCVFKSIWAKIANWQ